MTLCDGYVIGRPGNRQKADQIPSKALICKNDNRVGLCNGYVTDRHTELVVGKVWHESGKGLYYPLD